MPFGMTMPNRNESEVDYRYGVSGMEKDNEVAGNSNSYDFGARFYNPRVGRWLSRDPLERKYAELSPYNYVSNTPIRAVDPDGRLIIFINGYYGSPTAANYGGMAKHWGEGWVQRVKNHVGDQKASFYDGSSLVMNDKNTAGGNRALPKNLSFEVRESAGYDKGKFEAESIINGLERDADGRITETIKFVTSSMGSAYQRGFSKALVEYVDSENEKIDAWNSLLVQEAEARGEPVDPQLIMQRIELTIEFTVDLDAFQPDQLTADPNSDANFYMKNDGVESHFIAGGDIEGSTQISVDSEGNTKMHGHHPSWAPVEDFPTGSPGGSSQNNINNENAPGLNSVQGDFDD